MNLDLSFLRKISHSLGWGEFYLWHVAGFVAAYLLLSCSAFLLVRFLIRRGLGASIEARPLKPGQIGWEIRHSLSSMLFLSFFAVLALKLEQAGRLTIHWEGISVGQVLLDLGLFAAWNEVYFFACHWLLHRPFLFRTVHIAHHHSVATTPFSSLSFHWFEALLYSGTMISIQMVHGFNILSIMLWPAISLTANTLGHSNFSLRDGARGAAFLENNWRHQAHHSRVNRHFAFWTPWPDAVLDWARSRGRKGKA
jgi:sterol desaturase/sphingolipid hydroxylase (fatty acid hydroxylase superfamily)